MSLLSIGGNGPAAYMGNPALQQMLLAAAMRQGGFPGGGAANPAPQVAASGTAPPLPAGDVGGGLFFRGPSMDQAQPEAQPPMSSSAQPPSLPTPAPGQLASALGTLNGSPRVTPAGQAPVMADGSQPLQLDGNPGMELASTAMHLPTIQPPHHGIDWHMLAGIVGDALSGAAGQPGLYGQWKRQQATQQSDQQFELMKAAWQHKLSQDDPREVGKSLVQRGEDGSYRTLYSEPEPFEDYASAQGLKPGTPEYADAVKNYRLGAWSDDAVAAKEGLMGDRFGYQSNLQDARLANSRRNTDVRVNASVGNNVRTTGTTQRGQNLSHQDRQRGQNFQHQDRQGGQAMTDARVRGSAAYRGRDGGGRHGSGGGSAAVAVGPNGHQIVVQNGRWVDAQTGQPVQ